MYVDIHISYMFYTAKTSWGQIDPKEHWYVNMYRTKKTFHHVNFMFTQLSPLNQEWSLNPYQKIVSVINLETLHIEWSQIDAKDNRRVKSRHVMSSAGSHVTVVKAM